MPAVLLILGSLIIYAGVTGRLERVWNALKDGE